jgi:ribosomal protein RSM22 (predicted rRNA methylase)
MELPPHLRQAIERALDGVALAELAKTAAALSQRYREGRPGGVLHVASRDEAQAYLAVRLPATYAAVRASFAEIAKTRPDFAPKSLLDLGSGPGTVLWAAADGWPSLAEALLIEASPAFAACGEALAKGAHLPPAIWRSADIATVKLDGAPRDLTVLAYVLNELSPQAQGAALEQAWRMTADMLVIVEPGTPAGWQRILAARSALLERGAHIVAPCPHAQECPLAPPDWCHFARRVSRSRLHKQTKGADVPWEDEKYCYLAMSRTPFSTPAARVIARPRKASGRVTLKLCRPDGSAGEELISRRDGERFKRAARAEWGEAV